MSTQHILLDLDDTLIHCNRHFTWTREKFLNRMMELFKDYPLDRKLVDATQQQIDVAGVEQKGLGKNRFPESLVQTYRLMCAKYGKQPSKQEEKELFELGHSVYDFAVELYPHALSTLEKLIERGHELYLYTGGDRQIQTQKVINAGLEAIFPEERRFIFEHKNTLMLKKIMQKHRFDPNRTWMVGNSARNDIRPALELGLHAIHIPDAYGWEYDRVELDIPAKGHFHVLKSIKEVPDVIEQSIREGRLREPVRNIWIDADGCPRGVIRITREYAEKLNIPCWTVSNFHHELAGDTHIVVDDASQSADLAILNRCQAGDLVITQDIGLAAMVLGKQCRALGICGQEYRPEEIALLLELREQSAKFRRAGGRTKGPRKRTSADDAAFAAGLKRILEI
ncbi:DUF188 domain-containing protein [Effusibacillus pohliae]|uniref:DUF188 domain-containing protein n=1 Tax=Effusibacillus pohliae TaxID=232270 RepID=UPI00036AD133|nr:DUF188 domain-containing protein [Effusibacillus pohliae]